MPRRTRILFYLVAWLIVLMPFLFWRGTWFGRPLTDAEITKYLHDDQKPRHIQHALVQIGERISRGDRGVGQWSADLVRLAAYPVEEVRNTDAWIMGQDNSNQEFHAALLKMLDDSSPLVRSNAALALVRFGDAAGRQQILAMLKPLAVTAEIFVEPDCNYYLNPTASAVASLTAFSIRLRRLAVSTSTAIRCCMAASSYTLNSIACSASSLTTNSQPASMVNL